MWSRDTVVSHDEVGGNHPWSLSRNCSWHAEDEADAGDMVVTVSSDSRTAYDHCMVSHVSWSHMELLGVVQTLTRRKRQNLVWLSVVDWQWFIMMMFHDTDHDQLSPHNYLHCHCHRPWLTPLCHKDCRKLWKWTAMWRPVISIKSQFYHTFYPEIEATSRITRFCKTL